MTSTELHAPHSLTPPQLLNALRTLVTAGIPAYIEGEPGIGKTSLVRQLAQELGWDFVAAYPAMWDPTDAAGLPVPHEGRVVRMLDDALLALVEAERPTIVLLDEFPQAPHSVQAAVAPWLLEKRIGGKPLPAHVYLCAAGNRRQDRAGANTILSHLVSRVATLTLRNGIEEWGTWAVRSKVHAGVVAFLRHRPSLLHKFEPGKVETVGPYPCHRAWERVGAMLHAKPSGDILEALIAGLVGPGAAAECAAYLRATQAIDLEPFLLNPHKEKLPPKKDLGLLYALATGLAYHVKDEATADAVLIVAERMLSDTPEFASLVVRDAFNVWPSLGGSRAWLGRAGSRLHASLANA